VDDVQVRSEEEGDVIYILVRSNPYRYLPTVELELGFSMTLHKLRYVLRRKGVGSPMTFHMF
jgi:hypothetical protein